MKIIQLGELLTDQDIQILWAMYNEESTISFRKRAGRWLLQNKERLEPVFVEHGVLPSYFLYLLEYVFSQSEVQKVSEPELHGNN